MKKAKLAASLIAVSMAATTLLTGCNPSESSDSGNSSNNSSNNSTSGGENNSQPDPDVDLLPYADGTTLRIAAGYNNEKTGITFTSALIDEATGNIKLSNGQTYKSGDLKPTWQELEKRLNVKFEDKYQHKKASEEFPYWKEQMDQIDIVAGSASQLTEGGNAGLLVNLADYLDQMPNFKNYLEENPIVRLSIIGSVDGSNAGAIYFSPYFDGVNDIERMPLMRTDWVKKLLNGTEDFTAASSGKTATPTYQPYMPTSGKVEVDIVKADGTGTEKLTKNYDAAGGNIISLMNANGSMSGVDAVNMLRKYIDEAYGGHYTPDNRADLFIGQDAAWDADELVALLRCVVANAQTLNGTDKVAGLFARNDDNLQRKVDMFRFAGSLFGARGLESRQDYLYVGNDNKMHDARMEEATYIAVEKMHDMAVEGLFGEDFLGNKSMSSDKMLENDAGFMSYDYNQTQTLYNNSKLQEGEEYRAVMVPVARWYDGSKADGVYMRFTESWRSVKTDGWGISKKGVGNDTNKLNAALKLIDYAYSPMGQVLMSYGPDEFISVKNADGKTITEKYNTFKFNGVDWPVIADSTAEELWSLGKGNYTNYARFYLGSTLSFLKSQAFEYQCTTDAGKLGAGYISTAIALGTIKHPELAIVKNNPWYTSVPTVLPLTVDEQKTISGYPELGSGQFGTSDKQNNLLINIIIGGYSGEGTTDRASTIKTVSDTWNCSVALRIRDDAWGYLLDYYNG